MFWARVAALLLLTCGPLAAQSNPGFQDGQPLCANVPNPLCPGAPGLNQAFMSKLDITSTLMGYGAKCDGVTNDDAAISAWLAATVAVGKPAYFSGTCAFSNPIILPGVDAVTIVGASPGTSTLVYTGSATSTDIIRIGSNTTPCCSAFRRFLHFANWQLKSNTKMTGGAALHLSQIGRSDLFNFWVCTQECAESGNNNFWHGVWFDGIDAVRWCGVNAVAQQDAVRLNGFFGPANGSDLWLDCGGKISNSTVGLRIGGAFGGLYCDSLAIIGNSTNVSIDTTLISSPNLQILFQPTCINDSAGVFNPSGTSGTGVHVSDTMTVPGDPGIISFNGSWLASAHVNGGTGGHCLLVDSGVNYPIEFNGGTITNCQGDGIHNNSATAHIVVTGARVSNITGAGFFSVPLTGGVAFMAADTVNNHPDVSGPIGFAVTTPGTCPVGVPSAMFTVELGYVTRC